MQEVTACVEQFDQMVEVFPDFFRIEVAGIRPYVLFQQTTILTQLSEYREVLSYQ